MTSRSQDDAAPDGTHGYKTIGDVQLKMHVFAPSGHEPADASPCIVFFHGGGWNGGTPAQFYPHCHYLASRGMVAMSAEYRLKRVHGTSPYECVSDGRSALRWIRQNASRLGVDPTRIAGGGGSAGAQVAAATAACIGFDEPCDDSSIRAKPDALVLFNPVFDNGPGGHGHERVQERWQAFSPMHNIAQGMPPTIVFLGSEDALVPVATAEAYRQRMAAVGARCDVWIYAGQPHGFFNYRDGANPYYHATVFEADRFLVSEGYLKGAPTIKNMAVEAMASC